MRNPLQRLYQTKLAFLATMSTVVGVALLVASQWIVGALGDTWLSLLPLNDIGSALFTTGLLAVAFEYIDREDAEARAMQRLHKVIAEEAPAIRDAVLDGFAFSPEALADVTSPAMLERIMRNALAMRLGDGTLADEVLTDLQEQVIGARERWRDVDVSVTLTPWTKGPVSGRGAMFVATVRREYRVVPASSVMRFTAVSDRTEYDELLRDPSSGGVWYFERIAGREDLVRDAFELLQFTVDGRPRPIRRTERKGAQVFTVNLGGKASEEGREVLVSYTYQALVHKHSHLFYLDVAKPSKGIKVEFRHEGCGIRYVNAIDLLAGAQRPRITQTPESVSTRSVEVGFDGWVYPNSGVAFVWVLDEEIDPVATRLDDTPRAQHRTPNRSELVQLKAHEEGGG